MLNKKHLFLHLTIASALVLTACNTTTNKSDTKKSSDTKTEKYDIKETNVSKKAIDISSYDNLSVAVKTEAILDYIYDNGYQKSLFASGYTNPSRDDLYNVLSNFTENPYFINLLYGISTGDFDEKTVVKEYNKIYPSFEKINENIDTLFDMYTINDLKYNRISLKEFKNRNKKNKQKLDKIYKEFLESKPSTTEGEQLYNTYNYIIKQWIEQANKQYAYIENLPASKIKNYNTIDLKIRMSSIGEELNYSDTIVSLLDNKQQQAAQEKKSAEGKK